MKIAIVGGSRVGGTKIGEWLGYELGIEFISEPFVQWRSDKELRDNFKKVYGRDSSVIVKVFPDSDWDTLKESVKWDYIIGLVRDNERECAESGIRAKETNEWHKEYIVDAEWFKDKDIEEEIERIREWRDKILNDKSIRLQISYEGIFNSKEDKDKVKELLGISEWRFDGMLDRKYKYRKDKIKELNKKSLI